MTESRDKYSGFHPGSIGGPAALLASENIHKVECLDFPELMEAVWRIEVVDFLVLILVNDKGNDFYERFALRGVHPRHLKIATIW